jgi:hypothetical protein
VKPKEEPGADEEPGAEEEPRAEKAAAVTVKVKPEVEPNAMNTGAATAAIEEKDFKPGPEVERNEEEPGGGTKAIGIGAELGGAGDKAAGDKGADELGAELGAGKVTAIEAGPSGENTGIGIGKEPGEAEEESRGPKHRKMEKEPSMKSPMGSIWRRKCGVSNGGEGRQFREPLRRIQWA